MIEPPDMYFLLLFSRLGSCGLLRLLSGFAAVLFVLHLPCGTIVTIYHQKQLCRGRVDEWLG